MLHLEKNQRHHKFTILYQDWFCQGFYCAKLKADLKLKIQVQYTYL